MRSFLAWWYRFSLPRRYSESERPTTPQGRERLRYAYLTSGFLLLVICMYLPSGPLMLFDSPPGSSSPLIAGVMLLILLASLILGKNGLQLASAVGIIVYNQIVVVGVLATNPLDPSLFSIVYALLFAVIMAGALMPPVSAILVGLINCLLILLLAFLVPHTQAYDQVIERGYYSVLLFLPVCIQIGLGVITYVIMRNLILTVRRADRAEEIVALQQAISEHEEVQRAQQAQLEDALRSIAQIHARVANGDLGARVSLTEGDVLWSVAVPLNNLLNRLQASRQTEENYLLLQQAARYIADQLRTVANTGRPATLSATGTVLDPIIIELNKLLPSYVSSTSSSRHQ